MSGPDTSLTLFETHDGGLNIYQALEGVSPDREETATAFQRLVLPTEAFMFEGDGLTPKTKLEPDSGLGAQDIVSLTRLLAHADQQNPVRYFDFSGTTLRYNGSTDTIDVPQPGESAAGKRLNVITSLRQLLPSRPEEKAVPAKEPYQLGVVREALETIKASESQSLPGRESFWNVFDPQQAGQQLMREGKIYSHDPSIIHLPRSMRQIGCMLVGMARGKPDEHVRQQLLTDAFHLGQITRALTMISRLKSDANILHYHNSAAFRDKVHEEIQSGKQAMTALNPRQEEILQSIIQTPDIGVDSQTQNALVQMWIASADKLENAMS